MPCDGYQFSEGLAIGALPDGPVLAYTRFASGGSEVVVQALNPDGSDRWPTTWSGTDGCAAPQDLVVDEVGRVWVAGGVMDGDVADGFVIALDEAGNVLWTALDGSDEGARFEHVTALNDGTVVAAGSWTDVFAMSWIAGFSSTGEALWSVLELPPTPNAAPVLGLGTTPDEHGVYAALQWRVGSLDATHVVQIDTAGGLTPRFDIPQRVAPWGWTASGLTVTAEEEVPGGAGDQPLIVNARDADGAVAWSRRIEPVVPYRVITPGTLTPDVRGGFVVAGAIAQVDATRDLLVLASEPGGAPTWERELDLHVEPEYAAGLARSLDGGWYVLGQAITRTTDAQLVDVLVARIEAPQTFLIGAPAAR